MRRFSLSAVFFVLALALQVLAPGASRIAAMSAEPGQTAAVHCEQNAFGSDKAPADHGRHGHDCLSCAICASGAAPLMAQAESFPSDRREVAVAGWTRPSRLSPRSAKLQTHQPRAPPFLS